MIEFMDEDDLMADVDDVDVDSSPPEEVMEIIRSKTGWQDLDPTRIQIPALSLQHIHQYFIKNRLCKEHVTATKPFEKGYRIFSAQKVELERSSSLIYLRLLYCSCCCTTYST